VGIYQVMPVSENMGRIIMEGGNSCNSPSRRKGRHTRSAPLRPDEGAAGRHQLDEINRVTKD
jgi:type IV pilus assembly protein PilB